MLRSSAEYEKCKINYIYFLDKYVFDGKMLIKSLSYKDALRDLYEGGDNITISGNRGTGRTSLILGYVAWRLIFYDESTAIILDKWRYSEHVRHMLFRIICNFEDINDVKFTTTMTHYNAYFTNGEYVRFVLMSERSMRGMEFDVENIVLSYTDCYIPFKRSMLEELVMDSIARRSPMIKRIISDSNDWRLGNIKYIDR